MDCCESDGFKRPREIRPELELSKKVGRRGVLRGAAMVAGSAPLVASGVKSGAAKSKTIQLAFCSQLLCVPPYEVTRDGGYFRDEGLDVQLVYMRGSTAATQALVGGAVDYGATSFDDILQAFNRGAEIKRFYTEAEAAAQLEHSGIVPIYEIGEHSGQHFFSMDYIAGKSLAAARGISRLARQRPQEGAAEQKRGRRQRGCSPRLTPSPTSRASAAACVRACRLPQRRH